MLPVIIYVYGVGVGNSVDGVVDLLSGVRVAKVWPTLSQITDINTLGVENMNLPLNKLHYDNITKEISKLII